MIKFSEHPFGPLGLVSVAVTQFEWSLFVGADYLSAGKFDKRRRQRRISATLIVAIML